MSDCKEAVSWVNDDDFGNINLVDFIYDIHSCLRLMKNILFHHISRAVNSEANSLAKRGSCSLADGDAIDWCDF